MFGLWYLSLAIDEFRKFLGWSSIFDAFKSSKTDNINSNKAIEDKSSSKDAKPIPKTPSEPTKNVVIELPKPKLEPTKPAPEPPKPAAVESPKPKFEPIKPVVEPTKPVVEPTKPVTEPIRPAPQPPKPVIETPKPVAEPAKPISPSITPQKPSTPPKQITPPVTPPVKELPKREPTPPQPKPSASPSPSAKPDSFSPSRTFENGDRTLNGNDLRSNIKDATTSFLQEEGKPGSQASPKQQQPQSVQLSNVNFKDL